MKAYCSLSFWIKVRYCGGRGLPVILSRANLLVSIHGNTIREGKGTGRWAGTRINVPADWLQNPAESNTSEGPNAENVAIPAGPGADENPVIDLVASEVVIAATGSVSWGWETWIRERFCGKLKILSMLKANGRCPLWLGPISPSFISCPPCIPLSSSFSLSAAPSLPTSIRPPSFFSIILRASISNLENNIYTDRYQYLSIHVRKSFFSELLFSLLSFFYTSLSLFSPCYVTTCSRWCRNLAVCSVQSRWREITISVMTAT